MPEGSTTVKPGFCLSRAGKPRRVCNTKIERSTANSRRIYTLRCQRARSNPQRLQYLMLAGDPQEENIK